MTIKYTMPEKIGLKTTERIYLEIEKSRINREKSKLVLDKSLMLYFTFMVLGVIGFAFEFIDSFSLNVMVICGIVILVVGTIPYAVITQKEEKRINEFLKRLK